MAVQLYVAKWVADEQHSLDCMLCDETEAASAWTVVMFHDSENGTAISLCPEHMDQVVTAALARHKEAVSKKEHHWYLNEDADPWEKEARA